MLYQMVYMSRSTHDFDAAELESLLRKSREKNQQAQITGMLLYFERTFLQVLEGPKAAVEALYQKISKDSRHKNVSVLIKGAIKKPDFADWSMGFVHTSYEALKHCEGANDFFGKPEKLAELDSSVLKKLLLSFKQFSLN